MNFRKFSRTFLRKLTKSTNINNQMKNEKVKLNILPVKCLLGNYSN